MAASPRYTIFTSKADSVLDWRNAPPPPPAFVRRSVELGGKPGLNQPLDWRSPTAPPSNRLSKTALAGRPMPVPFAFGRKARGARSPAPTRAARAVSAPIAIPIATRRATTPSPSVPKAKPLLAVSPVVTVSLGPTLGKRYVTLGRGSIKKSPDRWIDSSSGTGTQPPQHPSPFAKHGQAPGQAKPRWRPDPDGHAAVAMLPQELLEMVFFWLQTWETGAAAQTCRKWHTAATGDKRVWANTVLPVRNAVFTPMMGGYVQSSDSERVYGAVVLSAESKSLVARLPITKVKMIGPNIHREPCHLSQLSVEIPGLTELKLHRCVLSGAALDAVNGAMDHLEHLILESDWNAEHCENLQRLTKLRRLTLRCCGIQDHVLKVLPRAMSALQEVHLLGCERLTKDGIQWCRDHYPKLTIVVATACPRPLRRPYRPKSESDAVSTAQPTSAFQERGLRSKGDPWGRNLLTASAPQQLARSLPDSRATLCQIENSDARWDSPSFWGPLGTLPCY